MFIFVENNWNYCKILVIFDTIYFFIILILYYIITLYYYWECVKDSNNLNKSKPNQNKQWEVIITDSIISPDVIRRQTAVTSFTRMQSASGFDYSACVWSRLREAEAFLQ